MRSLQERWHGATGTEIAARFGAVGAMKEALLTATPCDVMVSTDKMIDELVASGWLRGAGRTPLGRVRTGIAVRRGARHPDVSTPEALKAALLAADAVYFPDAVRSTAGIHFAGVMRELGIHDQLAARFRTYPNGATAMREMAEHESLDAIGCTQVTEIRYSEGVELVATLPARFELATTYTAALSMNVADPALAERFIALLAGPDSRALREAGGFET